MEAIQNQEGQAEVQPQTSSELGQFEHAIKHLSQYTSDDVATMFAVVLNKNGNVDVIADPKLDLAILSKLALFGIRQVAQAQATLRIES